MIHFQTVQSYIKGSERPKFIKKSLLIFNLKIDGISDQILPLHVHTQGPPYSCRSGVALNKLDFFFVTVFLLQGYKKSDAKVDVNSEVPNIITFQHHAIVVVGS